MTEIIKRDKITQIDPMILRACKKNGVRKLTQINTLNDYLTNPKTKGDITNSYAKNHPNSGKANAIVSGSKMLTNPKIEKSIADIMTAQKITKKTIIQTHKLIQDRALSEKDYTNARKTNQDFMKLYGLLDTQDTPHTQTNIQILKINYFKPDGNQSSTDSKATPSI